jgi:hypothetical protein
MKAHSSVEMGSITGASQFPASVRRGEKLHVSCALRQNMKTSFPPRHL